jgi:hypothetical protein
VQPFLLHHHRPLLPLRRAPAPPSSQQPPVSIVTVSAWKQATYRFDLV